MEEVTIMQILDAREKRVQTQNQLIEKFKKPIISFTMNIAGPRKTSPLIERAFMEGVSFIKSRIPQERIAHHHINIQPTGCEAFFSIDMPSSNIKDICSAIEEETRLGRLFDMDVLDCDGSKLSRNSQRGCFVCGVQGSECAARRLHPVSELESVTQQIINDYFLKSDRESTATLAVKSLIDEVRTTPKPGLVDSNNSGSHSDMNIDSFIASANALYPYFEKCFDIGHNLKNIKPEDVFPHLRKEGVEAEKAMYAATNGANTHKGIIYSMGIICAAIGRLWEGSTPYADISDITRLCSQLIEKAANEDFKNIDDSTAGGYYYHKYGIKGIRGEVLAGFSSVTKIALPSYTKCIEGGFDHNSAGVYTLIKLISEVTDTNLFRRGEKEGADYAAERAVQVLTSPKDEFLNKAEEMDKDFIKRNLSPGGCADLLAITYFLYSITKK